MGNFKINKVYNFWNSESCGERYALGESIIKKFLNEKKKKISTRALY